MFEKRFLLHKNSELRPDIRWIWRHNTLHFGTLTTSQYLQKNNFEFIERTRGLLCFCLYLPSTIKMFMVPIFGVSHLHHLTVQLVFSSLIQFEHVGHETNVRKTFKYSSMKVIVTNEAIINKKCSLQSQKHFIFILKTTVMSLKMIVTRIISQLCIYLHKKC